MLQQLASPKFSNFEAGERRQIRDRSRREEELPQSSQPGAHGDVRCGLAAAHHEKRQRQASERTQIVRPTAAVEDQAPDLRGRLDDVGHTAVETRLADSAPRLAALAAVPPLSSRAPP